MKNKPNFFVVGAAKSGTTSLYNILDKHPDIFMSPIKEPHFFCKDIKIQNFNEQYRKRNEFDIEKYLLSNELLKKNTAYIDEYDHYISLFKDVKNQKCVGEISNGYLYSDIAAQEIYNYNPKSKIIIVLRNPVERCLSHWLMDYRIGLSRSNNFYKDLLYDYQLNDNAWGGISHTYVQIGLYSQQIKRYYDIFPSGNIKTFFFEDLITNGEILRDELFEFLEIDQKIEINMGQKHNVAAIPRSSISSLIYKIAIENKTINKLVNPKIKKIVKNLLFSSKFDKSNFASVKEKKEILNFYLNDIQELEILLNKNLDSWKFISD